GYCIPKVNLGKAQTHARKDIDAAASEKKLEGMTDDQFKPAQNGDLGLAHFALGVVNFTKASNNRRVGPAIEEFKKALDLLSANPSLQGGALFYLGNAYEFQYPPNHRSAADALERSAAIQGPWQAPAKDLLAKVKRAGGG